MQIQSIVIAGKFQTDTNDAFSNSQEVVSLLLEDDEVEKTCMFIFFYFFLTILLITITVLQTIKDNQRKKNRGVRKRKTPSFAAPTSKKKK